MAVVSFEKYENRVRVRIRVRVKPQAGNSCLGKNQRGALSVLTVKFAFEMEVRVRGYLWNRAKCA